MSCLRCMLAPLKPRLACVLLFFCVAPDNALLTVVVFCCAWFTCRLEEFRQGQGDAAAPAAPVVPEAMTLGQMAEHSGCLLAIHGLVFQVQEFAAEHPGGEEVLFELKGGLGFRVCACCLSAQVCPSRRCGAISRAVNSRMNRIAALQAKMRRQPSMMSSTVKWPGK